MSERKMPAPVRVWVVIAALAATLLLAFGVCALHVVNAVSLRGEAALADYMLTDGTQENLVPMVGKPWADKGLIHIEGALLRVDQTVGAVNVRVALVPEKIAEGKPAEMQENAILLNTQMVRRSSVAKEYGVDDHCGFHAVVRHDALPGEGWQYRVMLADESDGEKRMIETDLRIAVVGGGLAYMRNDPPQEEGADD